MLNTRIVVFISLAILLSFVLTNVSAGKKIDLAIVGEAYGSTPSSENWDPDADLSNDGVINVQDLASASKDNVKGSEKEESSYTPLQESTTIISVEPENTFVDLPGKNFSIDVDVTDADFTWAFEFNLSWDPSIVNLTNITNGSFLSQGGDIYCGQDVNYIEGWVLFGCTLLEQPIPLPSGSGTLAKLNFTTLNEGYSPLNLSNTKLLNDTLDNYTHRASNGNVIVSITPQIDIYSPGEGEVLGSQLVELWYTIDQVPDWTGYSLNGKENRTVACSSTSCTTKFVTGGGPQNVTVYANDSYGVMGQSETRNFTVEVSGGCPHVYTWDGNEYVLDNNLLPFSDNPNRPEFIVEDYYKLEKPLAQNNGKYSLMIGEFEQEHSYFDQVQLLAIDHDSDVKIAPSPFGEILTYKNPVPTFAYDNELKDLTFVLNEIDGNAFEGHKDDFIILNFGRVDSDNTKLVMRSDFRCLFPCLMKWSVHVQVLKDGEWEEVAIVIPRNYWADDAVELSDYVTDEDLVVRLYFTATHKIDFVGLDTSEPEEFDVKYGNLVSATHSEEGNVKQKIVKSDETYAELIPGQDIKLDFTLPNGNKPVRDYIFYSKGHYYKIG